MGETAKKEALKSQNESSLAGGIGGKGGGGLQSLRF